MADNTLEHPQGLEVAPRGAKKDWVPVSGEVPPEVYKQFHRISADENKQRTDLIHEAVLLLIQSREARA